mmetsp:Transcript_24694/g.43325  ORF Transcript_24694/g.43325 Transcript_24694/m.43325 type:complete len:113 (-) Transcript_24694:41-379(-)
MSPPRLPMHENYWSILPFFYSKPTPHVPYCCYPILPRATTRSLNIILNTQIMDLLLTIITETQDDPDTSLPSSMLRLDVKSNPNSQQSSLFPPDEQLAVEQMQTDKTNVVDF